MKRFLPLLLAFASVATLGAQPEDGTWFYGFKAGVTRHQINDLGTTIIPDVFAVESYSVETLPQLGFAGGVSFYHRFYDSRFAVQPEVLFANRGGEFHYTDIRDLDYTIQLGYQYISLGGLVKMYPVGGINMGVGMQAAFNVANNNLTYTSNMPELGPDLQIQQSLREVLTGGNDIHILLQAGYDFPFGLQIEARYLLGLSDVLETRANGFNFIENKNRASGVQLTLGWLIEFPN